MVAAVSKAYLQVLSFKVTARMHESPTQFLSLNQLDLSSPKNLRLVSQSSGRSLGGASEDVDPSLSDVFGLSRSPWLMCVPATR